MRSNGTVTTFPIMGLLGLLFVGLKLTGYITWSWWWVLLPFYGPASLLFVIMLGVIIFAAVVTTTRGS